MAWLAIAILKRSAADDDSCLICVTERRSRIVTAYWSVASIESEFVDVM